MVEDDRVSRTPPLAVGRAVAWPALATSGHFGPLLIALVILILTAPVIAEGWGWKLTFALFASAVLVAGLQAARPGRRAFRGGLALAAADLALGQLVLMRGGVWLAVVQAALWLSTLTFVTISILDSVLKRKVVDVATLQAALCVYLLIGLVWVWAYVLIAMVRPDSFHSEGVAHVAWTDDTSRRAEFLRLLVFSYSTLSATGLGDTTTGTNFATLCANLQALTAQIYLAVIIAHLVATHTGQQEANPGSAGSP